MGRFHQETLERLHSPEQLDTVLTIRSAKSWIVLWVVAGLAAMVLLWSLFGSIQQRVPALGMLMPEKGGIFTLQSQGNGVLLSLNVHPGMKIKQGALVGHIKQSLLAEKLANAQQKLSALQAELQAQETFYQSSNKNDVRELSKQTQIFKNKIDLLNHRLAFLNQQKKAQKTDLDKGFITQDQYEKTQSDISQVQISIQKAKQALEQAKHNIANKKDHEFTALTDLRLQVQQAMAAEQDLKTQLRLASEIRTPVAGFIVDIAAKPGDILTFGQPVLQIQPEGVDMILRAYVRPQDGKKIKPDMMVHVAPTSVETSIYGTMKGKVEWVSAIPENKAALLDVFENEQTVAEMTAAGAPFAIIVRLEKDENTFSGFAWTSSSGPNVHLSSGTLSSANVIVKEQHPINLIIPLLTSWVPSD